MTTMRRVQLDGDWCDVTWTKSKWRKDGFDVADPRLIFPAWSRTRENLHPAQVFPRAAWWGEMLKEAGFANSTSRTRTDALVLADALEDRNSKHVPKLREWLAASSKDRFDRDASGERRSVNIPGTTAVGYPKARGKSWDYLADALNLSATAEEAEWTLGTDGERFVTVTRKSGNAVFRLRFKEIVTLDPQRNVEFAIERAHLGRIPGWEGSKVGALAA